MVSTMANLPLARSADKFLVFSAGTPEARNFEAEIARSCLGSSGLVLRKFAEASVGEDLTPASSWPLGDGGKAVRDVAELQTSGRRQEASQLSRRYQS